MFIQTEPSKCKQGLYVNEIAHRYRDTLRDKKWVHVHFSINSEAGSVLVCSRGVARINASELLIATVKDPRHCPIFKMIHKVAYIFWMKYVTSKQKRTILLA